MYDHPMQCTCRPAKPTPVQEALKLWITYIGRWVAIQHPVINFDMLASKEYKSFSRYRNFCKHN